MKINFLIPTTGLTGGIKVIFKHADYLAKKGHQVNLIYPYVLRKDAGLKEKIFGLAKIIRRFLLSLIGKDKIGWFIPDRNVNLLRVWNLAGENVPPADATLATANETADWLLDYSPDKGTKFYFIQDYEIWTRPEEKAEATYMMPFKKITISSYLKDLLEKKFRQSVCGVVFDGVDPEMFLWEEKVFHEKKRILMQYHVLEKKGFADGWEACRLVKQKHPEAELVLFGAYRSPRCLAKAAEFHYRPDAKELRRIYISADIFVWPSRAEGFGLPPLEAMAGKCAVVCTDTGAVRDYADEKSAVIVPPHRPELLAKGINSLLEDGKELMRISEAGYKKSRVFTWEESSRRLEELLLRNI